MMRSLCVLGTVSGVTWMRLQAIGRSIPQQEQVDLKQQFVHELLNRGYVWL